MKKLLKKLGLYPTNGARMTEAKSKIAELKERVTTKDLRIAELKERVNAKKTRIAELDVAVKTLIAEKKALSNIATDPTTPQEEVLHQIATNPFGRGHPVAADIMSGVIQMSDARSILAYRYLRGEGLEIGALHFPLSLPPGASAKYYDYRTATESRRAHPELPADKIVEVDYVGNGEKLDLVADNSVDFLIANHMLEHCQDVIGTLRVFYGKLKQEGVLFISLPDLRYTFDHRRQPTPFEHLERDEREGSGVSLYEHYREVQAAWSGKYLEGLQAGLGVADPEKVLDVEEFGKVAEDKHIDWHFHAWTQKEILDMFTRLGHEHGFDWEIEAAMRNGIEVIVVLRKTIVKRYDRADDVIAELNKSSSVKIEPDKADGVEASSGKFSAVDDDSVSAVARDLEAGKQPYRSFIDNKEDPIISVEETWLTESGINMRGWAASRHGRLPEIGFNIAGCKAKVNWSDRPDLANVLPDCPPESRRGFTFHIPRAHTYDLGMTFQKDDGSQERALRIPATGRPTWSPPSNCNLDEFVALVDQPGMRVLEIGSRLVSPGATSKRPSFKHAQYIGFDYHPDDNTDVVGDAHVLSRYFEPDERFDGIFSCAVLEHLAMPWAAALEMNRMLKPGGLVFHDTPFAWPWHEAPWDFWRFSHHGLGVLFSSPLGFEILKSGMYGPARIVPDEMRPEWHEFWCYPAYLGANILAKKVLEPDENTFQWNAALADVVESGSSYPKNTAES
jgi:predicted SAM-dependent methyltransferase